MKSHIEIVFRNPRVKPEKVEAVLKEAGMKVTKVEAKLTEDREVENDGDEPSDYNYSETHPGLRAKKRHIETTKAIDVYFDGDPDEWTEPAREAIEDSLGVEILEINE